MGIHKALTGIFGFEFSVLCRCSAEPGLDFSVFVQVVSHPLVKELGKSFRILPSDTTPSNTLHVSLNILEEQEQIYQRLGLGSSSVSLFRGLAYLCNYPLTEVNTLTQFHSPPQASSADTHTHIVGHILIGRVVFVL